MEREDSYLKNLSKFCLDKGTIKVPGVESTVMDDDNDLEDDDEINDQPAWDIGFEAIQNPEEEFSERSYE